MSFTLEISFEEAKKRGLEKQWCWVCEGVPSAFNQGPVCERHHLCLYHHNHKEAMECSNGNDAGSIGTLGTL